MNELQKEAMKVLKELRIGLAVAQQSESYEPTRIGIILLKDVISVIGAQSLQIEALEAKKVE